MLQNYKTTIPAIIMLISLVICFILLALKIISATDFSVIMVAVGGSCVTLIGLGAQDSKPHG